MAIKEVKHVPIAKPVIFSGMIKHVTKVLKSGRWTQAANVAALENSIGELSGCRYSVAVSSGSAGLHTVLSSFAFKNDDEIITTPFTFAATVNTILLSGAKPVFADISESDFNLDPEKVKEKITPKTKAILAVDLYGQPAQYAALKKIADKNNLLLIGDCAQSIGAVHKTSNPGKYCDAIIYSFYATKNIAAGEGGIIVTDNKDIADFAGSFRNQGQAADSADQYRYIMPGLNYRMTEIAAVIAGEQMVMLDKIINKRRKIAERYTEYLSRIPGVTVPAVSPGNSHVFHQYTIRIKETCIRGRDQLKVFLRRKNIQTGIYYPKPLHTEKYLDFLGYKRGDFPTAENISDQVLSLPIYYGLTVRTQMRIIKTITEYLV